MSDQATIKPITLADVFAAEAVGITREVVNGQWVTHPSKTPQTNDELHRKVAEKLNKLLSNYSLDNLAIEVISPSERIGDIQSKVDDYLTHGTQQVWCVYPETERVDVHFADYSIKVHRKGNTLSGGEMLPDFALELSLLFA